VFPAAKSQNNTAARMEMYLLGFLEVDEVLEILHVMGWDLGIGLTRRMYVVYCS
jgi:hypothetical protein